jgi:two-component system, NtrC family, sensor histidine kinase HydH
VASGGTSVLIVEDNRAMAENLAEILEGEGHAAAIAHDCVSARAAARLGFRVGLVDVRLPDGDGITLASDLKALAPGSEVILLTGFATLESAISAVRAGAWAYLVKPCAPTDVLVAVSQALRQVALVEEKDELTRRATLSEKLAALGAMAAGLAHEVRNPLNAALLQLQIAVRRLQAGPPDGPGALQAIGVVGAELERLNRTVADVLAFARPGGLMLAQADLRGTVDAVCTLLGPETSAGGLRLEVRAPEGPLLAYYDEDRLKQVLLNLLRNASEAAAPAGEVVVSLHPQGSWAQIDVEDSGLGIPAGIDPFRPFSTTKERGTGLGLATVQRIVCDHGGSVVVDRRQERTVFTVRIPLAGPGQPRER